LRLDRHPARKLSDCHVWVAFTIDTCGKKRRDDSALAARAVPDSSPDGI
jgi:hypothetical protein